MSFSVECSILENPERKALISALLTLVILLCVCKSELYYVLLSGAFDSKASRIQEAIREVW